MPAVASGLSRMAGRQDSNLQPPALEICRVVPIKECWPCNSNSVCLGSCRLPRPEGSIDGLRAFSRNPGRRASPTSLLLCPAALRSAFLQNAELRRARRDFRLPSWWPPVAGHARCRFLLPARAPLPLRRCGGGGATGRSRGRGRAGRRQWPALIAAGVEPSQGTRRGPLRRLGIFCGAAILLFAAARRGGVSLAHARATT